MKCNIISISRGKLSSMSTIEFYAFQSVGGWVINKSREYPVPHDVLTLDELLKQYGECK